MTVAVSMTVVSGLVVAMGLFVVSGLAPRWAAKQPHQERQTGVRW